MGVTAPTDVSAWMTTYISKNLYDLALDSTFQLTALATTYPDLEGKPGQTVTIPRLNTRTPADNLATTTPAVDDKLSGDGVSITIKNAVKSHAFYDDDEYAVDYNFDQAASEAVAWGINQRRELDLGAALYAGRNTALDQSLSTLTVANIGKILKGIPSGMRKRFGGPVLVAQESVLDLLFDDPMVANAAAFGSADAVSAGQFTKPIRGVKLFAIDDGVLPAPATAGHLYCAIFLPGLLVAAIQSQPKTEPERDARARLTRIVGQMHHGEGVVDSRGIAFAEITG